MTGGGCSNNQLTGTVLGGFLSAVWSMSRESLWQQSARMVVVPGS